MRLARIQAVRPFSSPRRPAVTRLLAGFLLVGLGGCARPPAGPPPRSLSEWRALQNARQNPPRPPEVSSDAEVTLNGYGITVPAGMLLTRSGGLTPTSSRITLHWNSPIRPDRSRTVFLWEIYQPNPGQPAATLARLAQVLARDSQANADRHSGYVASGIEPYTLHGLHGFRYYWKGSFATTRHVNHGFVYVLNGPPRLLNTVVYLRATDSEPYHKTILPRCEKAVLSFHTL